MNATDSGVAHTTEQLQVTIEYASKRADGSVETRKIHTVVSSTQRSEHLKTVRSQEVAGYSGPDETAPSVTENEHVDPGQVAEKEQATTW